MDNRNGNVKWVEQNGEFIRISRYADTYTLWHPDGPIILVESDDCTCNSEESWQQLTNRDGTPSAYTVHYPANRNAPLTNAEWSDLYSVDDWFVTWDGSGNKDGDAAPIVEAVPVKEVKPVTKSKYPTPTKKCPSVEELEEWMEAGGCEATDGCWVEPDGTCHHGHPSWLLRLMLI